MRRGLVLAILALSLLAASMIQPPLPNTGALAEAPAEIMNGGSFIENMGQLDNDDILFYSDGGRMAFTRDSVLMYCTGPGDNATMLGTVRFTFPGGSDREPVGLEPLEKKNHYYLGGPEEWRTGVGSYGKLEYKDIWENIDLEYIAMEGMVKYQFVLRPGADPSDIGIMIEGHSGLDVSHGEVRIGTGLGTGIVDTGLDVFYLDAPAQKVGARFISRGDDGYSFSLKDWDRTRTLVIDPVLYSGFIGGPGNDRGSDVCVDSQDGVYVLGHSDSLNFTTQPGVMEADIRDSCDIFVTRLNGSRVEYTAFLGGRGHDSASAIALDLQGNPLVTGTTYSDDFPTSAGCLDRTYNGVGDAFVLKLDSDGALNYSTYLGGSHDEVASSIAVDSKGRAHVTGETWSADFPTTDTSLDNTINGDSDIFIARLNAFGDLLEFSTFMGGSGSDAGNGIVIGDQGEIYVAGMTTSADFPSTAGGFAGGKDVFVAKLDQNANTLVYNRIMGGTGDDFALGIDIDSVGNAYITGSTGSDDFPITGDAYDAAFGKGTDAFVTKLGPDGADIVYSTYLGGLGHDQGTAIAASRGSVYVCGNTGSFNFPTTPGALDRGLDGGSDGFIARLQGQELIYSAFIGGGGSDTALGMCLSREECVFIAGTSSAGGLAPGLSTFNEHHHGQEDAYAAKLDLVAPLADAGPDMSVNESNFVRFNGSASWDNAPELNYTWSFRDRDVQYNLTGISPEYFFEEPGTYRVDLKVRDPAGNLDNDVMYVRVMPYPYPVAIAGEDISAQQGQAIAFNGSASRDSRGIVAYRWYFNDSFNDICLTGPEPGWVFTESGNYTVMLEVSDDDYNHDIDYVNVSVADKTQPLAAIDVDGETSAGTPLMLDGSGSADNVEIENYTWSLSHNGTNITLYGPSPTYTFWTPGDYIVELNVTDSQGNVGNNVCLVRVAETGEPKAGNILDHALLLVSLGFLGAALLMRYWPGRGVDDE